MTRRARTNMDKGRDLLQERCEIHCVGAIDVSDFAYFVHKDISLGSGETS